MNENFDPDEHRSDKLVSRDIIKTDGENIINLRVWDTAGLRDYYQKVVNFTADANFVFIVHDLDKKLDESDKSYLSKIYSDIHEKVDENNCKIVLVGSKNDLRHKDIVNSSLQMRLLEDVARHIPCAFVVTSAKNEDDPGINTIIDYIVQNSRDMNLPDKSEENCVRFGEYHPSFSSSSSSSDGCNIL